MAEVIVNPLTRLVEVNNQLVNLEVVNKNVQVEVLGLSLSNSGSGGVSNGVNVGSGNGVFKQLAGSTLEFKTLTAGTNITLTPSSNEISISSPTSTLLQILQAGANANNITITNLGAPSNPADAARLQDIPTTLPPSGAAGGDLSGTYPDPVLSNIIGLTPGVYGDGNNYPVLTVDSKGRITVASELALPTTLPPNGAAGGDLTGTYPNPTIALEAVTYGKIQNVTADRLLGRISTNGTIQEIELGAGLQFIGSALVVNEFDPLGWIIDGNAVTSEKKFGTTTAYDVPVIANNLEIARFKTTGEFQIASVAQDNLLTKIAVLDASNNVYWRDVASIVTSGNYWSLGGDTLGSDQSIGLTDNFKFDIITNNSPRITILGDGRVGIQTSPVASTTLTILGTAGGDIINLKDNSLSADRFKISDAGVITITQPAQNDANDRILSVNSSTGVVEWVDKATIASGGGSPGGVANEIQINDGLGGFDGAGLFIESPGANVYTFGESGGSPTSIGFDFTDNRITIEADGNNFIDLNGSINEIELTTTVFRVNGQIIADDGGSHIFRRSTASTNSVSNALRVSHTTTGTPAIGIGVGLTFEVETSVSNNEIGGVIEVITTQVAPASETFDLVVKTMSSGATASERLRINQSTSLFTNDNLNQRNTTYPSNFISRSNIFSTLGLTEFISANFDYTPISGNNSTFQLEIDVIARDSSPNHGYSKRMIATFKKDGAGTVTQIGTTTTVHEVEDFSSTTPTATISVTGGLVRVVLQTNSGLVDMKAVVYVHEKTLID